MLVIAFCCIPVIFSDQCDLCMLDFLMEVGYCSVSLSKSNDLGKDAAIACLPFSVVTFPTLLLHIGFQCETFGILPSLADRVQWHIKGIRGILRNCTSLEFDTVNQRSVGRLEEKGGGSILHECVCTQGHEHVPAANRAGLAPT